jgi:hypothetical protein
LTIFPTAYPNLGYVALEPNHWRFVDRRTLGFFGRVFDSEAELLRQAPFWAETWGMTPRPKSDALIAEEWLATASDLLAQYESYAREMRASGRGADPQTLAGIGTRYALVGIRRFLNRRTRRGKMPATSHTPDLKGES